MYNLKVLHYTDGTAQTRFYSHAVYTGPKKIVNKREYLENPFDGELSELVFDFKDLERREQRAKSVSRTRTLNKIYDYSRANKWEHFVTLTFDPDKVDRYCYGDCQKKLSKWLERMRKQYPCMYYLFVPEMHKDGAWHFHGLVSGISSCLEFSGRYTKKKLPIFNIGKYKFGWSTATEIETEEACCKYLAKYITKDLCEVTSGRKRYWVSRNCNKPIEETFLLDHPDLENLYADLKEDAIFSKEVEVDLVTETRFVRYLENKGRTFDMLN